MFDCRLCIHWTGQVYCEKRHYIVSTEYACNCKQYHELADELVRAARRQGL